MITASIKATLQSDIHKVWEVVLDVEHYTWRSDLSRTERIHEKQFIEYTKDNYPTIFTVTAAEPYKRWEFDMENTRMNGHWIGTFVAKGDETEVEFTEHIYGEKNLFEAVCKSLSEKAASTIYFGFKKALS